METVGVHARYFSRFAIVNSIGVGVNLSILGVMLTLGTSILVADLVAIAGASLSNYSLNVKFGVIQPKDLKAREQLKET